MRIDFIFDPVCPWCFIGKRRLEQLLAGRDVGDIDIEWRPFLLNPELPSAGIDRQAYLSRKFGSQKRIDRIYGAIADVGLSVAIGFNFHIIGHTPNTVNAHRLVRFAAAGGQAGRAVEALFQGYFVNGLNIGEDGVLEDIAGGLGLDRRAFSAHLAGDDGCGEIFEANAHAHRLGVNGVPAYVFDGNMVITGAQEASVLNRMLDAALAAQSAA